METLPPEPPEYTDENRQIPSPVATATTGSPIFFGPNGLRAGWSILVYVFILVALAFLARFELQWFAVHLHQSSNQGDFHPTFAIVSETSTLLVIVLATAFMARFEHRRVISYGLAGVERVRQFIVGAVSGFCFLSLLVGILVATHHLVLNSAHMPLRQSIAYAAAWGLCFFLVGMTEEFMLRGYLLFTLARGIRFWPAAILLAALFGAMHMGNHGESPFGMVAAGLIALAFSLSLWRLGHLWWAIGFHMSWDWAESYFYGTADSGVVSAGRLMRAHPSGNVLLSGGMTGPEGSAWVLLVVLLITLFIWKTQPYRGVRLTGK